MKIKINLENDIRLMWPTPVFSRVWPGTKDYNTRLRQIILEHEKNNPGVPKSVVGGWHSREDFMAWPHPEIAQLREWISEATEELMTVTSGAAKEDFAAAEISAWANVLRRGAYHRNHTHPGCYWSGVYYVAVGGSGAKWEHSGAIELSDPRGAVEMVALPGNPFGQRLTIDPEPGLMLMFPSWLRHAVHPFMGKGERITVAFNLAVGEPPSR
jgi:uncharacterized protein (TIGR02466 family)